VLTVAELDGLARLARAGRFTTAELRHLRQQALRRESAFLPRARVIWLGSRSLNHAAQEAAHLVRAVALGPALARRRPRQEAYLARCYEEALGFFGSRLLNPARRSLSAQEWAAEAAEPTGPRRRVGLEVTGLLAALAGRAPRPPPGSPALFLAGSQAFGAVLGDALARAYSRGEVTRAGVRGLFRDPLDAPLDSLLGLARAVHLRLPQRATPRAA
jgi:hypothetical protein